MSRAAVVHLMSSIGLLRTEPNIALRTVSVLIILIFPVGYIRGWSWSWRNCMHPHVSVQAYFLVCAIRTMRTSVLLPSSLNLSGIFAAILIGLTASGLVTSRLSFFTFTTGFIHPM